MLQHNRRIGDGVAFCNPIFFWYICAIFGKLNNRTKECGLQTLTVDFLSTVNRQRNVTNRYSPCDCVKPKTAMFARG